MLTFSDKKMQPIAGHLVEATTSGTGEIFFIKTRRLEKFFDQEDEPETFFSLIYGKNFYWDFYFYYPHWLGNFCFKKN